MNAAGAHELRIAVTTAGEVRLLRLTGEFDIAGVDLFQRRLDASSRPEAGTTVLDLRGLSFIDSSGLRAVIAADLRFRGEGRRLVLVKRAGQVEDVLKLTGLADRLELADEIPPELGTGDPV